MPSTIPDIRAPHPSSDGFAWPCRDSYVDIVLARFDAGQVHVHVQAPPGHGKDAFAAALSERLGDHCLVAWLAHDDTGEPDPILRISNAMTAAGMDNVHFPEVEDRDASWLAVAERLKAARGERPVLILAGAEHLADTEPDRVEFPADFLRAIRLVTVSLAPLHAIMGGITEAAAAARTVRLLPFPAPVDDFDLGDVREAQPTDGYLADGQNWFRHYLGQAEPTQAMKRAFEIKYERRANELWEGHPLANIVALEAMLDAIGQGERPGEALERFRRELDDLNQGALYNRLMPFKPGAPGAISAKACEAIVQALEAYLETRDDGALLAPLQKEWLAASGLCRYDRASGRFGWSGPASLIVSNPGSDDARRAIAEWARVVMARAREALADLRAAPRSDKMLRRAHDLVAVKYCETALPNGRIVQIKSTKSIVRGRLYRFHLQESEPVENKKQNFEIRRRFDVFVFGGDEGTEFYWRHQIRILTMLGRLRHPALLPFTRGGYLQDMEELGQEALAYIEIDRPVGDGGGKFPYDVIRTLNPPSRDDKDRPNPVFRQIVHLAEAIDLLHSQGIVHRAIDFRAVDLHDRNGIPQLVLTGFEFAANIRLDRIGPPIRLRPVTGEGPGDFACRAPQWRPYHADIVDPSLDVYAFGALASMLVTGLPDLRLDDPVQAMFAGATEYRNAEHSVEVDRRIRETIGRLNSDLLGDERWAGMDERFDTFREVLRRCLNPDAAKRPTMEDASRQLREWHEEYLTSFDRAEEVLRVSYPEPKMGEMLKKLQLISENLNLSEGEGREVLRKRIQEWIDASKWMHFREAGFPGNGDDGAASVRERARFIIAGPSVVFFASAFRKNPNAEDDERVLWLSYAVRRSEVLLPDPDDPEQVSRRATTEEVSWLPKPRNIDVIFREDVQNLPPDAANWKETLDQLRKRGNTAAERRLGREAALVWRTHRNIQLARDAIRNFPVVVHRLAAREYTLELDIDAFRARNEKGRHSFLRQTLASGKNERAFFIDTIQGLADRVEDTELDFILRPRTKGRSKSGRRIIGTIKLPLKDSKVVFTIDANEDAAGVPSVAQMFWFDSVGTDVAAERQSAAIERLERRAWLMDKLVTPRDGGKLQVPMPTLSEQLLRSAPKESIDEFNRQLRNMLSSDPLHAVQGPPGTGKTTLIAALVAEVLHAGDGSRMLVTSQSHAATDNVMLAVMDALDRLDGADGEVPAIALRLFSETTREQVNPVVLRRYSIDAQVRAARRRMLDRVAKLGAAPANTSQYYLKRAAERGYLEIRLKLERSAPLIFATTGAAMTSIDYLRRGSIGYDYVLIDEAAKAWAIDLVQPLAMANRAILVGDQNQLPPFGETELDAFLESALALSRKIDPPLDLAELLDTSSHGKGREPAFKRMNGWLKLFHRTFEKAEPLRSSAGKDGPIHLVQTLDRQFRSVGAIGSLVSRCFYPDIEMRNAGPVPDSDRRLRIPLVAGGGYISPAVLWIDTSGLTNARYYSQGGGISGLVNKGEADLIHRLLKGQRDIGDNAPAERLRVLSPYKKQVREIRQRFSAGDLGVDEEDLEHLFQTADSAQGAEADVVVVSMCRRMRNAIGREPVPVEEHQRLDRLKFEINETLGFLQSPQRLNVIMSRPRQQLILLGDFEYFKRGSALLEERAVLTEDAGQVRNFWGALMSEFHHFDAKAPIAAFNSEQPLVLDASQLGLES